MTCEARIQAYILAQLSLLPDCYFWRCNTGAARTKSGGLVKFGTPGQPDIQGCVAGRWIGIEVKTATGTQSPAQRAFQARIQNAGGVYVLARSLDDALSAVRVLL